MSESDRRSKDDKSWKRFYEDALLEFDPDLLPQRIAEAQKAVGERVLAVAANGDNGSEQEALEDARVALDDLERMRAGGCVT